MAKDKVRVGMIGVGGIARHHLRIAEQIPNLEYVAFTEPSEKNVETLRKEFPRYAEAPIYDTYEEMLEKEKGNIDATAIMSPHTVHFQQIMDSLDAGLHVLCEKPMVCKTEHAVELLKRKDERVITLSYQRHFQPSFRYLKKAIARGDLGELTYVALLQGQDWLEPLRGTWRHTKALSGGGQLNDSGSHLVDIMLWMTDLEAQEVYSRMNHYDVEVDIDSATTVEFRNGALGTISVIGNGIGFWEEISIWGTDAVAYIRGGKVKIHPRGKDMYEPDEKDLDEPSWPDKNFVDAILGLADCEATPVNGLRTIELTEAAWKSAETGKPVTVEKVNV